MVINHNIAALNTFNQLSKNEKAQRSSLEKLSSGSRINSAADDAAGLAISQKMTAQANGLNQASSNAQDGISLVQTAEGALSETQSILQRMNTIATQAANGTLAANDRAAVGTEVTQLNAEIDRIATTTKFNGQTLLNGTFGVQLDSAANTSGLAVGSSGVTSIDIGNAAASKTYTIGGVSGTVTLSDGAGNTQTLSNVDGVAGTLNFDKLGVKIGVNSSWATATLAAAKDTGATSSAGTVKTTAAGVAVNLQIGSESGQTLGITIGMMDKSAAGLNTVGVGVATTADASTAMSNIQSAIDKVSLQRANLGAYQNRLDHTINNLTTESQNLTAASSAITDVDMAKEMMNYTKNNILNQAAQAMLAQANQLPQGALQLLK
jgi:flagellin